MAKSIVFIHPWRGRQSGEINRELDFGVMAELVRTGKAKWCEDQATKTAGRKKKRGRS